MKCLYIGKFTHPYSTEVYVSHALEENGVRVKQMDINQASLVGAKWHVQRFKPDFVLFAKASRAWFSDLIPFCRHQRVLTVTWFWDLYWGYRSGRKQIPPQFSADLVLSTDGGHDLFWKTHKINHRVLRQGIHAPDHQLFPFDHHYDVAFVGSASRSRRVLLNWLRSTFQECLVHHTHCRGMELNQALSRVKIVVGDSVNVKNYWSNRIYEVTGRGGFFLHPETVGLDSEFVDGEHYASYPRGDLKALAETVAYWLNADVEREQVRRAGFEHCGANYTYTQRVAQLLKEIDGAI